MVLFKFNINLIKQYDDGFTFHYGSIQIEDSEILVDYIQEFTFHYGSIQI